LKGHGFNRAEKRSDEVVALANERTHEVEKYITSGAKAQDLLNRFRHD
jgi:hypothetical protein